MNYKLENEMEIPALGFGTYKTGEGRENIHSIAIEQGYRFFDTASLYETERSLGEALNGCGIKREEFFIQSKLWHDERGYREAGEALERSLDRLKTDYLDLYLIHWPKSPGEGEGFMEKNLETMRALSEAKKEGLIKGVGCSNFLPHHLKGLLEKSELKPQVDQLELHIGYTQERAVNYCFSNYIRPQAWSPLGRGKLAEGSIITGLSEKYGKTAAQINIRYLIEKGIIPIVKASTAEHMRQNMEVFDFNLTFEEISLLDSYPYNTWLGEHPDLKIPDKASNFDQ